MNESQCKNCMHYHQHYIIDAQSFTPVHCGHCAYPRLKHREPTAKGCKHHQFRSLPADLPNRDRVVHFLTTELLQYILSLDLPPKLE